MEWQGSRLRTRGRGAEAAAKARDGSCAKATSVAVFDWFQSLFLGRFGELGSFNQRPPSRRPWVLVIGQSSLLVLSRRHTFVGCRFDRRGERLQWRPAGHPGAWPFRHWASAVIRGVPRAIKITCDCAQSLIRRCVRPVCPMQRQESPTAKLCWKPRLCVHSIVLQHLDNHHSQQPSPSTPPFPGLHRRCGDGCASCETVSLSSPAHISDRLASFCSTPRVRLRKKGGRRHRHRLNTFQLPTFHDRALSSACRQIPHTSLHLTSCFRSALSGNKTVGD